MKITSALQAPRRRWIVPLLVMVISLTLLADVKVFVGYAVGLLHQGFLAVYVDAGSFVSGCF